MTRSKFYSTILTLAKWLCGCLLVNFFTVKKILELSDFAMGGCRGISLDGSSKRWLFLVICFSYLLFTTVASSSNQWEDMKSDEEFAFEEENIFRALWDIGVSPVEAPEPEDERPRFLTRVRRQFSPWEGSGSDGNTDTEDDYTESDTYQSQIHVFKPWKPAYGNPNSVYFKDLADSFERALGVVLSRISGDKTIRVSSMKRSASGNILTKVDINYTGWNDETVSIRRTIRSALEEQFLGVIPVNTQHFIFNRLRDMCSCPDDENKMILNHTFVLSATICGDTFHSACPVSHESTYVTWKCLQDKTWDNYPDFSLCRGNTRLFPDIVGNKTLSAIDNATALHVKVKDTDIYGTDVRTVLEGMLELQKALEEEEHSDNSSKRELFLHIVLRIIETLLEKPIPFQFSNSTKKQTLSYVQRFIEIFSQNYGRELEPNKTTHSETQTIAVTVMKQPANTFKEEINRYIRNSYTQSDVLILPEMFEAVENRTEPIMVVANTFKDLHCKFNFPEPCDPRSVSKSIDYKAFVNSHIIGATIGEGNWTAKPGLNQYVEIKLNHIYNGNEFTLRNQKCSWWNYYDNEWSTEGCDISISTTFYTVCHCTHLTNFAVIMDVSGYVNAGHEIVALVGKIGGYLSVASLLLTIVCTWAVLMEKKKQKLNHPTKTDQSIIHLSFSLCLFLLFFLQNVDVPKEQRIAITFFTHYFITATFTWNVIYAFFLFNRLIKVFPTIDPSFKKVLVGGYIIPLALTLLQLVINMSLGDYVRKDVPWIAPGVASWIFCGILSVILLGNIVIYAKVLHTAWFRKRTANASTDSSGNIWAKVVGSVTIFFLLGLTWSFGFVITFHDNPPIPMQIFFTVMSSFQGVFLFVLLVPLNKANLENLKKFITSCLCGHQVRKGSENLNVRFHKVGDGTVESCNS